MMDGRDRGRKSPASTDPLLSSGGQVTPLDVAHEDVSDADLDMLDGLLSSGPAEEDPHAVIERQAQYLHALSHALCAIMERQAQYLQALCTVMWKEVEAAHAPGTPDGDLCIVLTPDHPQRTEAIFRTAQRVGRKWRLYSPLRRALVAQAREDGVSLSVVKQWEMMVAVTFAVGEIRRPQGKRFDRYWPKRADGTPLELGGRDKVPLGLSWQRFTRWFIGEVRRRAKRDIRQMLPERPPATLLAELGAAFPPIGGDPETTAAEAEQHREQLERLLRRASPRQRELLHLLDDGFTLTESAALLGIETSTARVQLHRLRRAIAM